MLAMRAAHQEANCFWHPLLSPSDFIKYNTVTAKGPANDLTFEAQWPIMSYMPPLADMPPPQKKN
jgi:hypothetical protein